MRIFAVVFSENRLRRSLASALLAVIAGCGGGGTGNERDSGISKTTLRVEASDSERDGLHYQWRVTAGTVQNLDADQTVWTLPDGPGLHFAYVLVSDGKGGYAEQQYAVSTDALETTPPGRAPVALEPPSTFDPEGVATRLRFHTASTTAFATAAGDMPQVRHVYLPDMAVRVTDSADPDVVVFAGTTDLQGEVHLPKLAPDKSYAVQCASPAGGVLSPCFDGLRPSPEARVLEIRPQSDANRNLRLFGHVALSDGSGCGYQSAFFATQSAATVQLLSADGNALTSAVRINRFGDYFVDAAVAIDGPIKLRIQCEDHVQVLDVPLPASGYTGQPIELSYVIPNTPPRITKVVANGPEGSVRGSMVVPEIGAHSTAMAGFDRFLSYKGLDTRRSACQYYRALGFARSCDGADNPVEAISFSDWLRRNGFAPYGTNEEVTATYINRRDLNLVRRMVATRTGPESFAFHVCNAPGPQTTSQAEIDEVIDIAIHGERRVACVAMEWSAQPGVNGGKPFTKFLTFGPDGRLLPSVNLDGRGEKFMPGACVACHGGSRHGAKFPEKGDPSPLLGARFLPFDTGNYAFSTRASLTEAAQSDALHRLNQYVALTENGTQTAPTPTQSLISGWYADGTTTLNKQYVPSAWRQSATAGAARFYREVIGTSCRTCHTALGPSFDWDATELTPARSKTHVCGGSADLALNATMPNALATFDRLQETVHLDPSLAELMKTFLGCAQPAPDPAYPHP